MCTERKGQCPAPRNPFSATALDDIPPHQNLASENSRKAMPSSFSPPLYIFPSLSPFLPPLSSSIHIHTTYMYMRDHSKETDNMTILLLGKVFMVDDKHRQTTEQREASLRLQSRERSKCTDHGQVGKQESGKE